MSYLTDESAESGIVWDLGTYEVVEGSLSKGAVDLYLSGRKLDGPVALHADGRTMGADQHGRQTQERDPARSLRTSRP